MAQNKGDFDVEMEYVNEEIEFLLEGNILQNKRPKQHSVSSVLPPMQLSWHSIVAKPKEESSLIPFLSSLKQMRIFKRPPKHSNFPRKHILNGVYGLAKPGEVLAILGSSGAGKTTLLNILTQRNLDTINFSGSIRLNDQNIGRNIIRKISAYVQQDDMFIGTMTVLEHLRFMALLRMGRRYTAEERERRVQSVLNELGLNACANTVIGQPHRMKGISGGERKRLAFASEVMTSPPILFCDEPTTGLDSYLAQQVIQVLKNLARRKNMTVVVTIHQPSSQIFEMFDRVCFLAAGRLAFLGSIPEAIEFFDNQGYPLPQNFNPADHFISILSNHEPSKATKIEELCDSFLKSEMGQSIFEASCASSPSCSLTSLDRLNGADKGNSFKIQVDDDKLSPLPQTMEIRNYKASWLQQFCVLTKRSFNITLREPMLLRVRTIQTILISLLLGIIYFDTHIKQSTVMNINGLIFQCVANMNFMFQFAAVNAHLYRVDAFFLALNIAELVQYLTYPIIFSAIVYWMSGFVREFSAFLIFMVACIMTANTAVSIAYAASCVFGNVDVATAILPIFIIPLLAFGGFYINKATLPLYFRPLGYLSYFGYAFEIGAINEWTRIENIPGCDIRTIKSTNSSGDFPSPTSCFHDGLDVLKSLSFSPENLFPDLLSMLLMIFAFRLCAFIGLMIRAKTKD